MPGRREHRSRLELALADLATALDAAGAPWMIIGGVAVIARGVRRMTTDIDAAVRGDRVDVTALLRQLKRRRIAPRIDDAEQFAAESLVLLLRHQPTGVDLDVTLAWTDFEQDAIAEAEVAAFGSVKAPMASVEDLVVFKAIAARPKDLDDASALLLLYPSLDRVRVRERVSELAALAEQPELVGGLEAMMRASTDERPRASRAKTTAKKGQRRSPRRGE